jgi:hypothetical protein
MTTGMSEEEAVQSLQEHGLFGSNIADGTDEYANADEGMQKLLELVQKDVIAWRPEAGDVVGGVLRDVSESSEGDFGSYIILLIETPTGKLVQVHCFHTVLRRDIERRLQRGTLRTGDQIAIMYVGEADRAGKGKSAANLYRVVVNRPSE